MIPNTPPIFQIHAQFPTFTAQTIQANMSIQIVPYQPAHQAAYKALNEAWISAYFTMEPSDYHALNDPEGYILSKGGKILVALLNGEPVGVCALIKMHNSIYDYEMAKMAVSPKTQGKHIGWQLGQASIETAKALSASILYLESNTVLQPAINLYRKLGFQVIKGYPSPYTRCNIQMELVLDNIKM